jgi:hypothetical protein
MAAIRDKCLDIDDITWSQQLGDLLLKKSRRWPIVPEYYGQRFKSHRLQPVLCSWGPPLAKQERASGEIEKDCGGYALTVAPGVLGMEQLRSCRLLNGGNHQHHLRSASLGLGKCART